MPNTSLANINVYIFLLLRNLWLTERHTSPYAFLSAYVMIDDCAN